MSDSSNQVSLFIPCMVDQIYPEMGFAMTRLLRGLGYTVSYNPEQTCCGQPAYNGGHLAEARRVAGHFVDCFEGAGWVVCPSGSCTAMVRNHYDALFAGHAAHAAATALSARVLEFSEFCVRAGVVDRLRGRLSARVAFHNSCHSYRELGVTTEPFELLARVDGCEVCQPEGEPVCCGFGGLFYVKYNDISRSMASARLAQLLAPGVDMIVSNDPGCIMNLRQQAKIEGESVPILHLVEFLDRAMS